MTIALILYYKTLILCFSAFIGGTSKDFAVKVRYF